MTESLSPTLAATLTAPEAASFSACPACIAAPAAEDLATRAAAVRDGDIVLSLPTAHCAACITDVERTLEALPGVRSARVNLTQRRVVAQTAPGMAPDPLIAALAAIGYPAHELDATLLTTTETDARSRDLLMRMGVAGFAMMNVMLLSVAVWSGADGATRDLFHWISAAIALPTLAFSGQPFFASAWASLRARRLGMDVPISLALILAPSISLYETIHSGEHAYFDAAVSLCFFLLAGRYLDYRARAAARSAAEELAALEVPRAVRLTDGAEETVPAASLSVGDMILVRPGGRMPVDGVVAAGASELDRSLLTGETLPVPAIPGAVVSAGEVNLTAPLTITVTAAGRDTSLRRMADLVAAAEGARNRYTSLADRMARKYSPAVHILAFSTFAGWMYATGGDLRLAVNIAAAVLIITCPCALALAVPAVVASASGRLFRKGLLVKDGTALERLAEVDTVVFDKTGTLTEGAPEPEGLDALDPGRAALALALADASSHPLSRSLAAALAARGVVPATLDEVHEVPGAGVEGRLGTRRLRLGRADWAGADWSGAEPTQTTAVWLSMGDGHPPRAIPFADRIIAGAGELVAGLKAQGKDVILLSGDNAGAVGGLARRLGISDWQSGVRPEDKAARIAALAAKGRKVLMVGDGLNDTAALAGAHVSMSPASALDAARVASDIVILGSDIAVVADALRIAVQARRRIRQNFALSLAYNAVAVPFAIAGLATPLIAALAMSTSSITVSLNALRLK
jgi:Cu2+-exporting ATPase